jgi:hypothetical protein
LDEALSGREILGLILVSLGVVIVQTQKKTSPSQGDVPPTSKTN